MQTILISYYDNTLIYHPNIFFVVLCILLFTTVIVVCTLLFFFILYLIAIVYFFKNRKIQIKKRGSRLTMFVYRIYIWIHQKLHEVEEKIKKNLKLIEKEIFLPE